MAAKNELYPIFLKLHQLQMLIVGAGEVGYEKLSFILKSSPRAKVTMVAPWVSPKIEDLLIQYPESKVTILKKSFEKSDLHSAVDLVIAATDISELNREVYRVAREAGKLINVADTPDLCDFYLGAIVTKGDLKVAISTNGKSPTFAKRFRQLLEEILPEETDELLQQLHQIREQLSKDFATKVRQLNELTVGLLK
ncbi:MAG: hypothetical protein DHS20C18_07990 [Saprospiraceae bacterium]|nr:MAG: hypothetical protein DHS20C18_07990 [Saprospiraceae bacterium]